MRWSRGKTADLIVSDMEYKILKCTRFGVPTGRYLAFLPRLKGRPAVLGGFDSAKDAQQACEEHRREQIQPPP